MRRFSIPVALAAVLATAGAALAQDGLPGQNPAVPPVGSPDVQGNVRVNAAPGQVANAAVNANVEVLARGPVHEAFGESFIADAQAPQAIPRNPPEPINEMPPELMPEGQNVQWIPGYWSWDQDRTDYIWISGLWRDVPPGQRWVPGSWVNDGTQSRWVAGFWTSAGAEQIQYVPQPPASQEIGPNVAAPDANHFWIPGSWIYVDNNYQWRPGYWVPGRSDWVWVPSRYYWTPQGYIYTAGYWDYPPVSRATVFAPVYFQSGYTGAYQPANIVPIDNMMVHLFVRNGFGNYYFGNYYGEQYVSAGFSPWATAGVMVQQRGFYDPLWSYYRADRNGLVLDRLASWNRYYQFNPQFRPGLTLADTQSLAIRNAANVQAGDAIAVQHSLLVTRLEEAANGQERQRFGAFRRLEANQQQQVARSVTQVRDVQKLRAQVNADARMNAPGTGAQGRAETSLALQLPRNEGAQDGAANRPDDIRQAEREGRLPEPPRQSGTAGARGGRGAGRGNNDGRGNADGRGESTGRDAGRLDDLIPEQIPELPAEARERAEQQRQQFRDQMQNSGRGATNPGARGRDGAGADGARGRGPDNRGQNPNPDPAMNPNVPPGRNPGAGNPNNPANPNPGAPANPNPGAPANPNPGGPANPNPGAPANPNPGSGANPNPPAGGGNNPVPPPSRGPGVNPNPPTGGNNPVPPPSRGPGVNPNPPTGGANPVPPPSRGPGANPNPPGRGGANPVPPPSRGPGTNPNPPSGGANPVPLPNPGVNPPGRGN